MDVRAYLHWLLTGGRLFVYGTLMRGEEAHRKMQGTVFLGPVRTQPRYSLQTLGDNFEALAHGGRDAVPGELYMVPYQKLLALDEWEYDIYSRDYIYLEDGGVADAYVLRV